MDTITDTPIQEYQSRVDSLSSLAARRVDETANVSK